MLYKKIENFEFVRGVNFEFIESLKTTVQSTWFFLTIHEEIFAIQRPLLTLPRLGDIGV